MTENATMSCAINKTADTTALDQDATVEKICRAIDWINLLESHVVLLKAKIAKEQESKKSNQSTFGECTEISQSFYDQVLELWTEIQNYKIRIQNESNKFFNVLAPEVMGQPNPNPEIENFRRQITELGDVITPMQIIEMELVNDKEQMDLILMENQRQMKKFISEVHDKMGQAESHTHPREIQRCNEKLMKIKIARCVINGILAQSKIDYEENPDLVDLKIKWRDPISLKPKTE